MIAPNEETTNPSVSYTLTGEVIDDTDNCEPTSGIYVEDASRYSGQIDVVVLRSAQKEANDRYWTVTETTAEGHQAEEYLVQSLGMVFQCEFQ